MRCLLILPFLGLGLATALGCSSTLEEFRCTANTECIDDVGQGICHSSGYCAFVDFGECDGYRFGKVSGEFSGQCVDDNGELDAGPGAIDAGPNDIDADTPSDDGSPMASMPIANIDAISLSCGDTVVSPDGTNSVASNGATLVDFAWTLRSPEGLDLGTLSGPPADFYAPTANFFSGLVRNPAINITTYRDDQAVFVDTDGDDSLLLQEIDIPAGPYRLSFAAASAPGADTTHDFEFLIAFSETTVVQGGAVHLTEDMRTYTLDFSTQTGLSNVSVAFFTDSGKFWLDNVRVYPQADDGSSVSPLLLNSSFQEGTNGWMTEFDNPGAFASAGSIPSSIEQYGDYEIELVVTDSDGQVSDPRVVSVGHAACTSSTDD